MPSHLRCENVTVRFGGLVACNHVNLDVEEGRIVGFQVNLLVTFVLED